MNAPPGVQDVAALEATRGYLALDEAPVETDSAQMSSDEKIVFVLVHPHRPWREV